MEISNIKLFSSDLEKIIDYLNQYLVFDYTNFGEDFSVLASEEYYMRNNSTQLNMIVAKREDGCIIIDIIGGAGGSGFLNINWWSEKGYIKKGEKILNDYAEDFGLNIEEL